MSVAMFMYGEKRINDKWVLLGGMESVDENFGIENVKYKPKEIFREDYSNYSLYAILSNYCNNEIDTNHDEKQEEPYKYISHPRGIPGDVSSEISAWVKAFEEDVNEPSWLYLSAIIDFNWEKKIIKRKMVKRKYAYLFKDKSMPFPFDKWPDKYISYSSYVKDGVDVAWTETYRESVGTSFIRFIHELKGLGNPTDIRLVFWFC